MAARECPGPKRLDEAGCIGCRGGDRQSCRGCIWLCWRRSGDRYLHANTEVNDGTEKFERRRLFFRGSDGCVPTAEDRRLRLGRWQRPGERLQLPDPGDDGEGGISRRRRLGCIDLFRRRRARFNGREFGNGRRNQRRFRSCGGGDRSSARRKTTRSPGMVWDAAKV